MPLLVRRADGRAVRAAAVDRERLHPRGGERALELRGGVVALDVAALGEQFRAAPGARVVANRPPAQTARGSPTDA